MNISLPVDVVKPYMVRKLNRIEQDLHDKEEQIQAVVHAYEKELEKYNRTPAFIRIFKDKPQHPKIDMNCMAYDILQFHKTAILSHYDKLKNLLSVIEHTDTVTLSDEEIAYYGIEL